MRRNTRKKKNLKTGKILHIIITIAFIVTNIYNALINENNFFESLIFIILSVVYAFINLIIITQKAMTEALISATATLLSALVPFFSCEVPAPEIYTTNGNSASDNEIYFVTEWPLTVRYTTVPYEDPKENGIEFKENIPLNKSISVSAKSCLWGIKWSKPEAKDIIIIGDAGEFAFIETDTPGTSIKEITAVLTSEPLFPGDKLNHDMLTVEGITIAGDKVPIKDFKFSPDIISEGSNEITVTYNGFKDTISYDSHEPKIVEIEAEYTGEEIFVGDEITTDQFRIVGIYEDGSKELLTDCQIEPNTAKKAGQLPIKITKNEINETILVNVKEKPKLFSNNFIEYEPKNSVSNLVSYDNWNSSIHKDIRGESYADTGVLYVSLANMFAQMGGTSVNPITFEFHLILNPSCTDRGVFSGDIVAENGTAGSSATANISIIVDDETKVSGLSISGDTVEPLHFGVELSDTDYEVVIKIVCIPYGNGLSLGIVNLQHE